MQAIRLHISLLFCSLLILTSCTGTGFTVTNFPENGYAQTINYQFQAIVRSDVDGECKQLIVRVRPLNKMYSGDQPPDRLQLYDDDCHLPLRFERINYIERETSGPVRLTGPEVHRFWSEHAKLEGEMIEWLWQSGVNI